MPKKSKDIYKRHAVEDIRKAVELVKSKQISIRKAAEKFDIAKSTLADYVSGRSVEGVKAGRNTIFPKEVENAMAEKIMDAADKGFGLGRRQVLQKATAASKMFMTRYSFKRGMPSKEWFYGFKNRNPKVVTRAPEPLSESRSKLMNKPVISNYFSDLGKILDDLQLKNAPDRIWNMDEKNVRLDHRPIKVLARRGTKSVPGRVSNSRESVTIVATVNAAGKRLPPAIIVKGKTPKSLWGWNTSEGPDDAYWTYQQNAWMKDFLGVQWFKELFLPSIGAERPQFLILDSHSSHEVTEMLELARDENIHVMTFPPHCTHHLQPLDKSVFSPLSSAYSTVCSEFMNTNPNNSVLKWTWPSLFKVAWESAVNESNIKSGFHATGIYPFNPSIIGDDKFKPSLPFDKENHVTDHVPALDNSFQSDPLNSSISLSEISFDKENHVTDHVPALDNSFQSDPLNASISLSEISFDIHTGIQIGSDILPESFELLPVTDNINDANHNQTVDWNSDLNTIFELPVAERKSSTKGKRKSITTHRLLTSDEIIGAKKAADDKKRKMEQKKQENKLKRELKRAEKELKQILKT